MRQLIKSEKGTAIVEATMLLPFCMLMVLALYYASIFVCQKANLQANVENALIYYKNVDSDTYVHASDAMSYQKSGSVTTANGSSYASPTYEQPYRFLGMKFENAKFERFFRSMCGYMFFDTGSNVKLTTSTKNYVVYKEIKATATQTVKPAISLSVIGVPDSMKISCTSTVVISNADDFIRNTDFVFDIVEDTKLGQAASGLVDKAKGFYEKFKQKFGVS